MTHIKTVKVTNPSNVLVQVPRHIVDDWGLQQGDSLEVFVNEDEKAVTVKPRGRYINVRAGSNANQES